MQAKHTPGPWAVTGPTIVAAPTEAAPTGYALAHILNPYAGATGASARVDANAALIAAAPDMLAALLRAEQMLSDWQHTLSARGARVDPVLDAARAAIARATGGAA